MLASGVFWQIIAISAAIAGLFLVGTRILVYVTSGRSGVTIAGGQQPYTLPTLSGDVLVRFLWTALLMGVLAVATALVLLRFVHGIGAVTNLSDAAPWGLWIGFDVMSGVALAAGAFVIAGTAHILRIERFKPLVRPAILTGLLGYLLVIAALLVDLGRPYNVWRPLVHWQHHSALWEVGCCVATYTTVLFIEFSPVILERLNGIEPVSRRLPIKGTLAILGKVSIVFVILGVVLSTLHQSSLGSLWVLMPTKVHPLWYSIYLPVFFWLSAVAVGLAMTIVESTLSSRAFGRSLERDLLQDLAKAAFVVLAVYLVVRAVDMVSRGAWGYLFEPSLQSAAYWMEIGLGVVIPMIIFAVGPLRKRHGYLFSGALMVVFFGVVLNRLNVSITSLWNDSGMSYHPSWMEVLVTVAFVTAGVLVFGLVSKYLPVFPEEE